MHKNSRTTELQDITHAQLDALQQALQDRENEIVHLKDQQKNPRFLLKSFIKEVRIRLDRRASRDEAHGESLRYKTDQQLATLINNPHTRPQKILNYIAQHDAGNIYKDSRHFGAFLLHVRRFFWIVTARTVKAGYFTAKATFKLLKRVKHAFNR